jgi:hypothetical protein
VFLEHLLRYFTKNVDLTFNSTFFSGAGVGGAVHVWIAILWS